MTTITPPEIATLLMTTDEAKLAVATFRDYLASAEHYVTSARQILLNLHDREGWRALGYENWRACAVAELGLSQAHVYRLLTAAQIEHDITPILADFSHDENHPPELPEAVLRPLAQLDTPEERQRAARTAIERAGGAVPSSAQMQAAVAEQHLPADYADIEQRFARLGWRITAAANGHRFVLWPPNRANGIGNCAWMNVLDRLEAQEQLARERAAPAATPAPAPRVCARCAGPWGAPGSITTDAGRFCPSCASIYLETLAKTQAAVAAGEVARATIPGDIRQLSSALGLIVQEREDGFLLHWPWENTALMHGHDLAAALAWLRESAPALAIEQAERRGWELRPTDVAGQQLYACVRPWHALATAQYADVTLAYGEALRIEATVPAAPKCEHCERPATDHRNIRGLLADRCARCKAEQERLQQAEIAETAPPDMAALRAALDRAEALGAVYDPMQQRADGRMPVLAPPGFGSEPKQPAYYDADELTKTCDLWEAWQRRWAEETEDAPAPAQPAPRSDWWNCGVEHRAIHAAIDRGDRAGAIRAALDLAVALAPSDLASIADQLDDRQYEALAVLCRPVETEVGT